MGRARRFFSLIAATVGGWWGHPFQRHFVRKTRAGVYVDEESALKTATVWACVQYLTKSVGQLPWRVYREDAATGQTIKQPSNGVDYLLHTRPNREMGSFTFRQIMLAYAILWGNGVAEIQWDNAGRAIATWPIMPWRVQPRRRDAEGFAFDGSRREPGEFYFEVDNGTAGRAVLNPEDAFHIRGFGHGPWGLSVIQFAAQTIGWAQATELFGASFFGDGMNPSGVIEIENGLTKEGLERLKEENKKYRGPDGDKTLYLDKGMKWTRSTIAPNEGQFVETLQHQVEEICRWMGVPPHKAMHLLRATFSNIEHQSIEVVVDSVVPWVVTFEQEADYKLFGANRAGLHTKMDLKGLLRGDSQARAELHKAFFDRGVESADDICRFEDMNPVGGKFGSRRYVPLNSIPVDLVDEYFKAKSAPAPGAAPDPNAPAEPPKPVPKKPAQRQRRVKPNGHGELITAPPEE